MVVCLSFGKFWLAGDSPCANKVAADSGQPVHAVRLYSGDGAGGKGGLQLDQEIETRTAPPESDGEKARKTNVAVFPPTRRNWAKVLVALNEQGVEPPDAAERLGFDAEEELLAALPEE